MDPYPLLLEPMYKEKVWGGRRLEALGRALPGDAATRIGESWEVADLATTSPSGGGGEAARSVVANGPLAGRTLGALLRESPRDVLGAPAGRSGAFPLLVKYLDARENLSVQVHPSVAYARRHPDAHLKSEAWYVVEADPGAVLYKGVVAGTARDVFERAVQDGTVPELLVRVPARSGDVHYLPSGTCHALGAGILVAEVQTPSDTTFRVYDWDRRDRELHVAQALECVELAPVDAGAYEPADSVESGGSTTRTLVRCPHFGIDEWLVPRGAGRTVSLRRAEGWMVVRGTLEVRSSDPGAPTVSITAGGTAVLPAALRTVVAEASSTVTMLRVTLP